VRNCPVTTTRASMPTYYDSYDELTAAGISENEYCG
jgi:hypothetical protein